MSKVEDVRARRVRAVEKERRDPRLLAVLAVSAAVVMWGMSAVAIKAISTSGLVTALYRLWFAIPLLWMTALVPAVRRALNRQWVTDSLAGGMLFALHQILFFNSLKLTTVTNVNIIGALQPAVVLSVAGSMFGETATRGALLWSLAAFGGAGLVMIGSAGAPTWSPAGDVLAAINLFAFTAYFLASRRIRERTGAWAYVLGMTTVSGFVILAVSIATGQDFGSPRGSEWLVLLGLAIFPGTLGHVLTNWAHAHATAFVISMLFLAVPVIAAAGAMVLLGEVVTKLQLVGGAMVLLAIANVVRGSTATAADALAGSAAETDAP